MLASLSPTGGISISPTKTCIEISGLMNRIVTPSSASRPTSSTAVVLVSREATDEDVTSHKFTKKVAWMTVGSGVAFGLNFVLIAQAPAEARLWPLVFARLAASVMVLVVAAITGNLAPPSGTPLRLAMLAAVLDVAANIAMLLALHASLLSLAGVLMSLYPAATVLLAIVVLRERVTRWQAVGMVLALASVAMIAAG